MLRIAIISIFLLGTIPLFTQTKMAESLRKNVVAISTKSESGFGFITGEHNGKLFIATAAHVVEQALNTNVEVKIKFYDDYQEYQGIILRNYADVDIALLEVTTPASFSWESKCLGVASQKAKVAFVGREGEWYVPSGGALGDIFSLTNNRVQADITSITVGTSGAPLIVESGIVGLIVETDGIKTTAIDINQLRITLGEYDYFFQLKGESDSDNGINNNTKLLEQDIKAFKRALTLDTIPAYQSYIRDFPRGEFKDVAIKKIQELEAEKAIKQEKMFWEIALLQNDEAGYLKYLEYYPNGLYFEEAKSRIQSIQAKTPTSQNKVLVKNSEVVVDPTGNTYTTKILADGRRWMTQNLNLKVLDSWCYDNDPSNCEKYGRLYDYQAAKKVCTNLGEGWRLPYDYEWTELASVVGGYLNWKESRKIENPRLAYENLIFNGVGGLNCSFGGSCSSNGKEYYAIGSDGYYWANTEDSSWMRVYFFEKEKSSLDFFNRSHIDDGSYSVRCINESK